MEDLGEVKSVDNQGICDGNSQTSRSLYFSAGWTVKKSNLFGGNGFFVVALPSF